MTPRMSAALAAVVLGGALVAVIGVTTPWRPLGPGVPPAVAQPELDFTRAEERREVAFHRALRPPALAALAVGLAAGAALGLTSAGWRAMGNLDRAAGGRWPVAAVLGAIGLVVVGAVVRLPFSMRTEVVRRRYGLSTQDWVGWFGDLGKGMAVSAVLLSVVAVVLLGLMRRAPDTWWAWAAGAAAALVVVVSFGYPVVVEPIFNRFTPLAHGELRSSLLELARRDGVDVEDVLVADASRRTMALNAYVSGLGTTRRIVVYDTLVARASAQEVRLVVAHELGHVVENDVRDGTLTGALGAAVSMPILYLLLSWAPLLRRAGLESAATPRALPLIAFLLTVLTFVAGPVESLVSRRVEARADVHSLELTRDAATFVESERRLAVTNLSDLRPNRVLYLMFASHPSAPERIELARAWARRESLPAPPPLVAR